LTLVPQEIPLSLPRLSAPPGRQALGVSFFFPLEVGLGARKSEEDEQQSTAFFLHSQDPPFFPSVSPAVTSSLLSPAEANRKKPFT